MQKTSKRKLITPLALVIFCVLTVEGSLSLTEPVEEKESKETLFKSLIVLAL